MSALKHELTIQFSDLTLVQITCPCGTGVLLNLDNQKALLPGKCPGCNLDLQVRNEVETFRELYRFFSQREKEQKSAVTFRIPTYLGIVSKEANTGRSND